MPGIRRLEVLIPNVKIHEYILIKKIIELIY